MKKILFLGAVFGASLYAQSFDAFKAEALKNSPYLKANTLRLQQTQALAKMITRYKNPNLELELSNFDASSQNKNGYRASLSQPIRLWGVGDDKQRLSDAQMDLAKTYIALKRSEFVRTLSLIYIDYKTNYRLWKLALKNVGIAQKTVEISKERLQNGTIAKVKYEQAEVEFLKIQNSLKKLDMQQMQYYYTLLEFGGLASEVQIDKEHRFVLQNTLEGLDAPQIAYMRSKAQKNAFEAAVFENRLEWMELYAEYEKEPDQKIGRLGISVPLPLFNARKEEQKVASLQAKQMRYRVEARKNTLEFQKQKLLQTLQKLTELTATTKELIASQKKLLEAYQEGYRIANTDILELQIIQSRLIDSEVELLGIEAQREKTIVEYNYITGAYND